MLAEGVPGGFAAIYTSSRKLETLGVCRRGYFVEGLGGAQFALPGAVERLRAQRDARGRPAARAGRERSGAAVSAPRCRGRGRRAPARAPAPRVRRPARVAGAHVVLVRADVACYVEAGGRGLQTFVSGEPLRVALSALAEAVRAGRIRKLELERVDGEPVLGGPAEPLLVELGFRSGPRRLTLSA